MVKEGFVLKCLLHFFQREQEMRMGELGPRGAINMGGTGVVSPDITRLDNQVLEYHCYFTIRIYFLELTYF